MPQGIDHTSSDGGFDRTGLQAPQPFRSCLPGHHSGADGSRLPCRARFPHQGAGTMFEPSPETPLSFRRVLLRPLSHSAAFEVPCRPGQGAGMPLPVATELPALASIFDSEVTWLGRITARSAWVCPAFRHGILSRQFPAGFPPTKTEARGIAPTRMCCDSAPSPRNLTGKPSLTYLVGPFMVELFTAGRLTRSPGWSIPVPTVASRKLPTPARLKELALASPGPRDGIFTRFVCWNDSSTEAVQRTASPTRPRSQDGNKVCPHRPSSVCTNQDNSRELPQAQTAIWRIG